MEVNLAALWITFQAGFTETFIASSVVVSVALSRGKRNAVIGTVIGFIATAISAFILQAFLLQIPGIILNWVSSLLLLLFGIYLIREFVKVQHEGEGLSELKKNAEIGEKTDWGAITVAAWGVFNEGLEILVVWLAITLKSGPSVATAGAGIGIVVVLLLAVLSRKVFRLIPPKYLDLVAGIALIIYGIVFAIQAIAESL
jgi:uncharacterized membrane protein